MKYAAFKLAGVALSLSLAWTSAQAAALRVAADPVPAIAAIAVHEATDAVADTAAQASTAIEDPAGPRNTPFGAMHLAYLRDPSGNKICAVHRPG